jgi:hypothetical protein
MLHHQSRRIFLLGVFLLNGLLVVGQDMNQPRAKRARTLEDYQPSTLKEISAQQSTATLLPLQVKATFTGLARPLSQTKKAFLRAWANHYAGSVDHYTAHYQTEMQFSENGVPYWLTVTTKSLEQLQSQMKKGQAVELYLIRISETASGNPADWLLLVEKFK